MYASEMVAAVVAAGFVRVDGGSDSEMFHNGTFTVQVNSIGDGVLFSLNVFSHTVSLWCAYFENYADAAQDIVAWCEAQTAPLSPEDYADISDCDCNQCLAMRAGLDYEDYFENSYDAFTAYEDYEEIDPLGIYAKYDPMLA